MTLVSPPPSAVRTQKRPGGALRLVVWAVFILLAAGFIYLLFFHKSDAANAKGGKGGRGGGQVLITTATAKKGDIGDYIKRIGNVVPVHTASIFPQVTGVVKTVYYTEGQAIKEGDPLVDIDSSLYDATLLQAQGTLEKDQSILDKDQMDLDRYEDAWKLNAIAKQQLDDQRHLVDQDKGTVKNDLGVVHYDQAQVDYCHIKSPLTGRVGLRLIDPGNLVNVGSGANSTPFVVIAQMQPITVVFSIPESNGNLAAVLGRLKELKEGETLTAEVYDSTDTTRIESGDFVALDSQIDTTTGSVRVRVQSPNDELALFPNQFVNVHLLVRTLKDAILIPTAAIQQNGQTSYVYVIKDGAAYKADVTPGVVDDKLGITQVDGLKEGDVIADSSFDKLQDGSKVTVQGEAGVGKGKSHGGKGGASPAPDAAASPAAPGQSASPGTSASPHRKHGSDTNAGDSSGS